MCFVNNCFKEGFFINSLYMICQHGLQYTHSKTTLTEIHIKRWQKSKLDRIIKFQQIGPCWNFSHDEYMISDCWNFAHGEYMISDFWNFNNDEYLISSCWKFTIDEDMISDW